MARFAQQSPRTGPTQPPAKPFDITEYTAAEAEITRAATGLQGLLAGVDRGTPASAQAAGQAATMLEGVLVRAYGYLVRLIALLLLGGLAAALAYRGIVRHWLHPPI